jgi:phosphomannomutase
VPVRLPGDLMVSVSGFRGRVGSCLTPELVASLAASFGAFLKSDGETGPVYLGRDSRTSGEMYSDAARAGLVSVGSDVVELGIAPTPTILLAAEEGGAGGALAVTASHNPAEWNALKLAGSDGTFLDATRMQRFQRCLAEEEIDREAWNELGSVREDFEAVQRHIQRILGLPLVDVEGIRARGFHVALDCVRGAGGPLMSSLLEALGCRVTGMDLEPDGRFSRDPEPTAKNLEGLGHLVRESGADLGVAVDPDVDRLSLVDGAGNALGEDLTLALCAATVLRREAGAVVTNLSTSNVVEDVARSEGVALMRAPVGEVNVARRMAEVGAVIGGEGNGGVILPDLHLTRDAPVGCALILQHLLDEGTDLVGAARRWPDYTIVKEKTRFPTQLMDRAYDALVQGLPAGSANTEDGLRLDWPGERKWIHIRPSGTEPIVRLIAEAPVEVEARELLTRAQDLLQQLDTTGS